ncbi:phenylalanine--tRNA ligase subunit alpha [Candidatus Lokiarchaeum ossiferum]|uniref:phenylalanine--tRNA ligase subunit alpha n=1 Tax=Candidatus Lokiarchaeum ossiferum TaxID=2951803 RepID=UPI00352D4A1F
MTPTSQKIALKTEYMDVLKELQKLNKPMEAWDLSKHLSLGYEKLMSGAVYTLEQNGLATFSESEVISLKLNKEGLSYYEKGLPERQLFKLFVKDGRKEVNLDELAAEAAKILGFKKNIFFIALTNMKKNKWVVTSDAAGTNQIFIYSEAAEESSLEHLLKLFTKDSPLSLSSIPKELQNEVKTLTKRKMVNREKGTVRIVQLTEKGLKIKISEIEEVQEEVLRITSDMLKSGEWKEKLANLKHYEVGIEGPRFQVGKLHPMTIVKNQIREVFFSMGFQEIRGPIVETAFYNFDSLYQPQGHPAREMHDTFYLKKPNKGILPKKEYVAQIKSIHEDGGDTGSTGWGYDWSEDIAKKLLLRTHTTATTIRHLAKVGLENQKLPVKVFCIDRVFRNEKVDRTHLAEFQQIDGIVIAEDVSLSDLIGQITEFYRRMGFKKVITRPGFFPYTEPSMEVSVYSEELGAWLEMGGSGIFRPEVTYAWGIKHPVRVLAWGLGLERLAMLKLKREDIRDLYQSNISWLREVSY